MRLSNPIAKLIPNLLYFSAAVLVIITCCEMAFIGKNLTYSTKFTPPNSEENSLRNQTYITEAQALILFISIIYTFLIPATTFSCQRDKRKPFRTILLITLGASLFLLVLNFYFLTGASMYRNYLNEQYQDLNSKDICQNSKTSLCMIGSCNRMRVFEQAQKMAIAFIVINIFFSMVFGLLSILVNKKKKESAKMELIV